MERRESDPLRDGVQPGSSQEEQEKKALLRGDHVGQSKDESEGKQGDVRKYLCSKKGVFALVLGQCLSIFMAVTGATSQELALMGIEAPTTQSFFNYILLTLYFIPLAMMVRKERKKREEKERETNRVHTSSLSTIGITPTTSIQFEAGTSPSSSPSPPSPPPSRPLPSHSPSLSSPLPPPSSPLDTSLFDWRLIWKRSWKYVLLALIDVEANFLVVKSYEYTTYAMVTILDCFATPCVVILSFFILKTRYRPVHIIGVLLCLGGIAALVATEISYFEGGGGGGEVNTTGGGEGGEGGEGSHGIAGPQPALGCSLCLAGAFLYAVSNVGQEKMVIDYHRYEFLAFLGLFGSVISGVQVAITEREALANMEVNLEAVGLFAGFALAMFAFYSLTPILLEMAGAAFLNISLLTSDFLAIVVSVFLFHYVPTYSYYISFVATVGGLVVYNLRPTRRRKAAS